MNLNYSESDFRKATCKEIIELLEIQQELENNSDDEYVEKHVNIADLKFI